MMRTAPICVSLAGTFLLLAGCTTTTGGKLALTDERRLSACGVMPNCVSSDETRKRHGIEPLALGADPQTAWEALITYVENDPSYEIKVQEADYLRAVSRTRVLRFVDDVEFHWRPEAGQIAMRSASRVGISDWGKNRRRLEAVRQALTDALVLGNGD